MRCLRSAKPAARASVQEEYYWWEKRWPVLDPSRGNKFLECWEVMMLVLLLLISVISPFETALTTPGKGWLFAFNMTVFVLFLIDMGLQFITAQPDHYQQGAYILRPWLIVKNYLLGTFCLDLLATFPVDIILVSLPPEESAGRNSAIRFIRLFRLLRLLRLTHLGKLIERLQVTVGIMFSYLTMIRLGFLMLVCCHWSACLWCFVGTQLGLTPNWIGNVLSAKTANTPDAYLICKNVTGLPDFAPEDRTRCNFFIYLMALYWATMTTTTIGYGDIVPMNLTEFVVACCMEVCCAMTFAVIIGEVCAVTSTLQPDEIIFKTLMDDLNRLMEDQHMPTEMRRRLRAFFHYGKKVWQYRGQLEILELLSPMLQGMVAKEVHEPWLAEVRYLKGLPTELVINIARKLFVNVLAQQEEIPGHLRKLHIIRRGVCVRVSGMRVISSRGIWGEDMVLENQHLRNQTIVKAVTYVDVLTLEYTDLIESIQNSSECAVGLQRISRARRTMALQRGLVKAAKMVQEYMDRSNKVLKDIQKGHLTLMIQRACLGQDLKGRLIRAGSLSFDEGSIGESENPGGRSRMTFRQSRMTLGRASMSFAPLRITHDANWHQAFEREKKEMDPKEVFKDLLKPPGAEFQPGAVEDLVCQIIDTQFEAIQKRFDARLDEVLGTIGV